MDQQNVPGPLQPLLESNYLQTPGIENVPSNYNVKELAEHLYQGILKINQLVAGYQEKYPNIPQTDFHKPTEFSPNDRRVILIKAVEELIQLIQMQYNVQNLWQNNFKSAGPIINRINQNVDLFTGSENIQTQQGRYLMEK